MKTTELIVLGGGLKVTNKEGHAETNMPLRAKKVSEAFNDHPNLDGKKLQVWFEPGKFLVSAAGYLVASVNVLKENGELTFAGLDTGFNHLIRPMFYDAYHRIENISNPCGIEKPYIITGNICETDTFAWNRKLN